MLSEEQYLEKKKKVECVVKTFLTGKYTIEQISEMVKIPRSSVQRYLNDGDYITAVFGQDAEFIMEQIKIKLAENKKEGNRLGGMTYAENNSATRDSIGYFTGSKKR